MSGSKDTVANTSQHWRQNGLCAQNVTRRPRLWAAQAHLARLGGSVKGGDQGGFGELTKGQQDGERPGERRRMGEKSENGGKAQR